MTCRSFRAGYFHFSMWMYQRFNSILCICALILLCISVYDICVTDVHAYDGQKYRTLCQRVLQTVEGKFGSLLTAAAGLGAIVSSAAGGFRMAWSLLVVAVGAFTLRTYQEIWFAPCGG